MNRAQRRQLARANGWRGAKAKRQRVPTTGQARGAEGALTVDDTATRQHARMLGLTVPPSVTELEQLRHS